MSKEDAGTILYHYCNCNTFYSIVKGKQIWMTDISRSNDYDEMEILLPEIYYAIEDEYKAAPFELIYKGKKGIEALQQLLYAISNELIRTRNNGFLTSYVVCFSEEGDLLGQWRGYANNGKGCSIGFSLNELQRYCDSTGGNITIQRVEYIAKTDRDLIAHDRAKGLLYEIRSVRDEVKRLPQSKSFTERDIDEGMLLFLLSTFEDCILDSLHYKWNGFQEEKEWRMYFKDITKDDRLLYAEKKDLSNLMKIVQGKYDIFHNRIDFYAKEDSIISYFPVNLMDLSDNPIKTVFLGPKNRSYKQDIKLLFAKEHMGIPIIQDSHISYR